MCAIDSFIVFRKSAAEGKSSSTMSPRLKSGVCEICRPTGWSSGLPTASRLTRVYSTIAWGLGSPEAML